MKPWETMVEVRTNTDVQIVCQMLIQGRKINRTIK